MWYIAHVGANTELSFKKWAEENGGAAYVPLAKYLTKPRQKKKPVVVERPAFRGYVFVTLTNLKSFNGYAKILKVKENYLVVKEEVITSLKQREESGEFNNMPADMSVGTLVLVVKGLFSGFSGRVLKTSKKNTVLIELGERNIKIPLDSVTVSKVK